MTWGKLITGAAVFIPTAAGFMALAGACLIARPDGLGLLFCLGWAWTGTMACRSVIRDRL